MEKILYLHEGSEGLLHLEGLSEQYQILHARSLKEAAVKLLDIPSIIAFISDFSDDEEKNHKAMSIVFTLNEVMPFITTSPASLEPYWADNPNLKLAENTEAILPLLERAAKNRRLYARTNWPLVAHFYKAMSPEIARRGEMLSLSAGGAFIKINPVEDVFEGENYLVEISFQEEKCLLEGQVVRIRKTPLPDAPEGFAMEFVNMDDPTRDYLSGLVKHYILSRLLLNFEEE